MKRIGAHVSAAGGVANAPLNAAAIGATAFAFFSKNQRQWQAKPLTAQEIEAFQENCRSCGFDPEHILIHDSYLINLGHPEDAALEKSRLAFLDELQRCEQLGCRMVNFHPGSGLGKITESECLQRIAASVDWALEQTSTVVAVVENTAGQGSTVGYLFDHLADIRRLSHYPERIGICIDTAHLCAAGYDLVDPESCEEIWQEFDTKIGLRHLKGMHLNDSKVPCSSRVDRHASLGEGVLGWEVFERIAGDPRFDEIPLILETPQPERWPQEIARLQRKAGETDE
ncbi:deoxyribonuclease IV [candidate division KSB1 bacterium]|nr:deoxyribonuclease IV [candidate division KSB1 bacterium]